MVSAAGRSCGGKEGFIAYFEQAARDYSGKRVKIKRVIAEGDYVVLHCRPDWPTDHVWAGIGIFRLDNQGKVVEHWDVLQIVPDQATNSNGIFCAILHGFGSRPKNSTCDTTKIAGRVKQTESRVMLLPKL